MGYEMPPEWRQFGAHWGNDGRLYFAEWQKGFHVHDLRALFFDCQQLRSLQYDLNAALRDLETAEGTIHRLEGRVRWYSRQVCAEARMAPLLLHYELRAHRGE